MSSIFALAMVARVTREMAALFAEAISPKRKALGLLPLLPRKTRRHPRERGQKFEPHFPRQRSAERIPRQWPRGTRGVPSQRAGANALAFCKSRARTREKLACGTRRRSSEAAQMRGSPRDALWRRSRELVEWPGNAAAARPARSGSAWRRASGRDVNLGWQGCRLPADTRE
jgi:hypothetical protein